MSRYRKYTDNYLAILAGLRLNQEVGIDTGATSKAKYTQDVLKDKYRATVVELRDPRQYNAETAREQIYAPANYGQYPRYGQGEYDAAFSYWITTINPDLVKIYEESSDQNLKAYLAVPYIDDNDIPCAFSVTRFGHGSTAQFFITLVRNTHAPYEEREVVFIAHNDIMKTSYYAAMHGAHNEEEIAENRIMPFLRLKIGSQNVSQLAGSLFTQEGTITEENFVQLKARIRNRNVDNRDILIPQIPRLIKIVNKINVGLAQEIQSKYTQDFVDFFKQKRYEQLLRKVIADAKAHWQTQPKAITELQDLYLEFLIIQLHADRDDSWESFLTGGISETESAALLDRFKKVAPQARNTEAFAEKINQFYRNIHYTMLITKLMHTIHDCESKLVRDNAKSELQWIRSLSDNFLNLKPSKQKTAIAFVTQLISFTQTPNDEGYRALKKLYPKVRLEPAKLENVKSNLEIIRFNQQITALKRNLKTCPHPYVKRELAKNVEFVRKILPSFQDSSIDRQISINQFLEKLNELTTQNKEFNLSTLEKHYTQLSLPIIPREERAQLLLPTNIACMQHEIEKNNYLFDTQGRILVSTLDSTQNNQPTMWSLDVATHQPVLDIQFDKLLSTALQKQTSAVIAGMILDLFKKSKTQTFPLQQSLQIFLNQIAQTYQKNMSPDIMSDETREAALLATMRTVNVAVIQSLAQSLVKASINSRGAVLLRKLSKETLNTALIEAQETLREQGKATLIQNLREQLQNQAAATPSLENALNPIVCFDITPSLATEITSMQIESEEYSCRQIKTFRFAASDFVPRRETNHVRIHSNALGVPEDLSAIAYQTQFSQRLSQIARTYTFRNETPVTYYLYGASSEQIQQSIAVIHNFNRRIKTPGEIVPLCWLQTYNLSEPGIPLGAPLFTNTTSEITLLFEMTLCYQISTVDTGTQLNLVPYRSFLNPAPSFFGDFLRSTLFASSSEGKQTRRQITELKNTWQQAANSETDLSTQASVAKALQKLLAFDLHYAPEHALLIQALSLTIQKTSILNDESAAQQATTLALGHAQIFDLATLPTEIQVPLNTLLRATEKRTTIQAAKLLSTAMEDYCAQHQNTAGMLPIYQKATEAAHEATSPEDIARTKAHLLTPPEPSKPAVKISTRQTNSPPSSTHRKKTVPRLHDPEQSATSLGQGSHGLFAISEERSKQPESISKKAGRNKAAAFNQRRTPGSGSDSST
ncbi:MAG: hypothetical protein NTZ86_03325 [Legionellales bacterium]|nr:hypothetical protein [Legionellales bacterium]